MANDLRLPQRDVNVKWVDGNSISTTPIPVEIKSADITLNVTEIAFGYVGIEDQLGNKLVINPDGSINVAGGGGTSSSVTVTSSALPTGAATDSTVASGNTTLTGVHTDTTAIKNSLAGTIAVSGTFWQATQPVSGTFWQATQPVSGTFWQVTQPVSIASMPSTPVTGTFWQATQPVSGTFFQATQPISSIDTTWQNAANRQFFSFSAIHATGATTEALISSVANTAGVAAGAANTYTVPVGKTLRLTALHVDILNTTTVANRVEITVRAVQSGTASASSPIMGRGMATSQAALAASGASDDYTFPEGAVLPAGSSLGVSQVCSVTTASIVSFVLTGYLY